jgi:hypothetical protein
MRALRSRRTHNTKDVWFSGKDGDTYVALGELK